jgi:hypothetical protein
VRTVPHCGIRGLSLRREPNGNELETVPRRESAANGKDAELEK